MGICFVLFLDRASLPHFRVFAMFVGHPCGNCLSEKHMETAGKMTEHLRLQGKVCFTRPKHLALEEFIHEFQCIIRASVEWNNPRGVFCTYSNCHF